MIEVFLEIRFGLRCAIYLNIRLNAIALVYFFAFKDFINQINIDITNTILLLHMF